MCRADIHTEKWESGVDGTQSRVRSFQSPFETALLSGKATVTEEQSVKIADDGTRMVMACAVQMDGDVPYCECYRVHTLLDVTVLGDPEQASGVLVRIFMGAEFVKWTLFESRIKEMISTHGAESWEAWEEEAVKYIEEAAEDGGEGGAPRERRSRRRSAEHTYEIDRGGSDTDGSSDYETGESLLALFLTCDVWVLFLAIFTYMFPWFWTHFQQLAGQTIPRMRMRTEGMESLACNSCSKTSSRPSRIKGTSSTSAKTDARSVSHSQPAGAAQ